MLCAFGQQGLAPHLGSSKSATSGLRCSSARCSPARSRVRWCPALASQTLDSASRVEQPAERAAGSRPGAVSPVHSPWSPPASASPHTLPTAGYPRNFAALYELHQPLGAGSFKTVFVGRHRQTGERVAVQVIGKEREGSTPEANVERIKREVDITQRLQVRPETIKLHGVFEDEKNIYMVTEMCDGGTLEQYMQRHGRMQEADAAILVGDVLHVLSECNQQRICYADIKPANILLKSQYPEFRMERLDCQDAPPDARVIDFGCSQLVEEGSKLAKRTGTPLFLPPEMFMRHWGPEADLWSLGMVTYLLLSGRMPFWGGAMGGVPPLMVMQEILSGDISFEGEQWDGISEDAVDFVTRLLDRDFNSRMTAEQALQHTWMLSAGSGDNDLEQCSLDWDEENEYNMMNMMSTGSNGRDSTRKRLSHAGQVACSLDEHAAEP